MSHESSHVELSERLSQYIDGELPSADEREVDTHLAECDACRTIVGELRALRRDARALAPIEPPERVWIAIASGIESGSSSRASTFHTALAAAAAAVLAVSLWIAIAPTAPDGADARDPEELANMVTEELRAAESHYQNAIAGLEEIIAQNQGELPADLNQTLSENLDLIEQTIDESKNAIAANPTSPVAQDSLLDALRRKVSLLQSTILLINEVRKGEGANALDLIDEIRATDDPSNPI